jgi:rhodanese-related sulfurtransferase
LTADEFLAERAGGSQVLDVRWAEDYAVAHLSGSVNVGLTGQFATWCGSVLDAQRPIVLVAEPGHEAEAVTRLGRIGFDNVVGYLEGGIAALQALPGAPLASIRRIKIEEFGACRSERQERGGILLDVRNPGEWEGGTVPGAVCIPLGQLRRRLDELPKDRPITVYCAGGFRSATAMSMIEGWGNADVTDLVGGYMAFARHE